MPVMLLLAVLAMSVIGFGIILYAMCLMGDLQSDYINPYSFVDRLNGKLKFECWMHVPMLCCCACAGYPIGSVAIVASAGYRYWVHKRNDLDLDPTMVFRQATQDKLWTRWLIVLGFHVAAFFYVIVSLVMLGPGIDYERMRQIHETNAAFHADLRRQVHSGNASFTTIMAHSMTTGGMMHGGMMF